MADYLQLAKDAFEASSAFIDSNWRADWDYSLKAFRQEHATGSKYLSEEYKARSRLVSPKTRSIIRKTEAAGAVAMFANMELVSLEPENPDDPMSVASSDAMKAVLEYRLQKTIRTYETVIGGIQDAQTQGVVISHQYWDYQKRDGKVIVDKPCIELRPVENIRIDAGASWIDPVHTSPYFCDIIPMYVCDVRGMMENEDEKTGKPKWKKLDDETIARARPQTDTTRSSRLGRGRDPHEEQSPIKSFDTVWVMRWFIKDSQGRDQCFYTLGTEELLTTPQPIEEVYFHGMRPYEMGYAILETHKVMKTSVPMLVKPIQLESTDIRNQRLDNVKFVLNKRYIVARGRQVDVQSLLRNVAGGVTLATDPKNDIQEMNWPDVTSSAFVEHDRLNAEFDDLAGNFSPSTRVANNAMNDTLGGAKLATQSAGIMTDYMLRTITETWWERVLRQLVKLEAYYETDDTILAVAANKARLFPKYGISQITDNMMTKEMSLTVNMGFGASDPGAQLSKFLAVTKAAIELVVTAPPGFNVAEQVKELYSKAGYRDGARFFNSQQDPRLMKAMQMVQQLQAALQGKGQELQATMQVEQQKLQSNERIKGAQLQVDQMRIQGDLAIRQAELRIEAQKVELMRLELQLEAEGTTEERKFKIAEISERIRETHLRLEEAQLKLEGERQKLTGQAMKLAAEVEKSHVDLATAKAAGESHDMQRQMAETSTNKMGEIDAQLSETKSAIDELKNALGSFGEGVAQVLQNVSKPSRKAVGMKLRKDGGKTKGVSVVFDDGTADEVAVE